LSDPEAAAVVEREVHGFDDVRLGGDELDAESRGDPESAELLLGAEGVGAGHVSVLSGGRGGRQDGRDGKAEIPHEGASYR
jgi:hypothetical protein